MTTTIYPTLISKIQTILEGSSKIKEIFSYPTSKITKYPCAIYVPSEFTNEMATTGDNMKVYEFRLWVVIGTNRIGMSNAWGTIMPKVMDQVLQAFDEGWNFDTINGHRTWCKVTTGGWESQESEDGIEIQAEINLEVKVLTDV